MSKKFKIISSIVLTLVFLISLGFLFINDAFFNSNFFDTVKFLLKYPTVIFKILPAAFFHFSYILVALGITIFTFLLIFVNFRKRNKFRKGVEHGSARWGRKEEINPYFDTKNEKNNLILSQNLRLRLNGKPSHPKYDRNKNILVIGGSGSGKTRFFVKPNIMQMNCSLVITDPKGTILNELGTMLFKSGYQIKVLNLIEMSKSLSFNPMKYMKTETDILRLAEVIIRNTSAKDSKQDFWVTAEKLLYQSLIALIFFEFPEEEKNLTTLSKLISTMEIRDNDPEFKNAVDLMFEELEQEKPDSFAVKQYKAFKIAAGDTAKSILISCSARLAPFNIPEVSKMTSTDEMDLDKLGEEKTALFVIISDTDPTYNFLVSILYTQLFNLLCTLADFKYGGKLPIHVRFLLDEFANIGQIPDFEKLIATIRSRNISANIILQTMSQLKSIYKTDTETIAGNCDTTLFLGGKEKGTLKEISEILGKETISDVNFSDSRGTSLTKGMTYSKLARDLMTLDELATLDNELCLVMIRGLSPFKTKKYEITNHPMYKKWHANSIDDPRWFFTEKYLNFYRKQIRNKTVKQTKTQRVILKNIEFDEDMVVFEME